MHIKPGQVQARKVKEEGKEGKVRPLSQPCRNFKAFG